LEHDDYQAQLDQAKAAVEAAKAGIENNRRQRQLQDAKIDRALSGIDQAKAQISAAQAGKEAVEADVVRTRAERARQEALYQTHSTTQQKLEQATADEGRFTGQFASREADLEQAKTSLRSNELAVLAEQRTKSVLESQESQLIADLHAKEAALEVAQVNLGYTKITAPGDGAVGERTSTAWAVGVARHAGFDIRFEPSNGFKRTIAKRSSLTSRWVIQPKSPSTHFPAKSCAAKFWRSRPRAARSLRCYLLTTLRETSPRLCRECR
jgi:hypothetical protein